MIADPSQLQMLLQKIRQFPVRVQRQTLELYIFYVLRNDSVEDIKDFCKNFLEKEVNNSSVVNVVSLNIAINHEINDGDRIKQRISKKLETILSTYGDLNMSDNDVYQRIDKLDKMLHEIQSGLKKVVGNSKRYDNLTVSEMLNKVQQERADHDEAMLNAAQVMFDRIFESINPDAAENYMDQSLLQVGPSKKSALLDASKEKYNQLLEYHQSGKFIRDYTVNYKRLLRKNSS